MFNFRRFLNKEAAPFATLFLVWGTYFIFLFGRILEFKSDGLYAGHVNVWSDWSLHIGITNLFAYKDVGDWFAYHPFFAGGKFTYPFLTNIASSFLLKAGVSLVPAMILPSIGYSLVMVTGLYFAASLFLRSKWKAVFAVSIFFLSSGLGFVDYLTNLWQNFSYDALIYPAKEYSRIDSKQWYAGNVIVGLIAPQRGFLLGMTLTSWAVFLLFRGFEHLDLGRFKKGRKFLIASGCLVGILPISHMHSLIAISCGLGLAALSNLRKWREAVYFALPAVGGAGTLYKIFIAGGIQNPNFMNISLGWTSEGGFVAWVLLWFKIWGLMLPLALVGCVVYWRHESRLDRRLFATSFFAVFGVANIIFFQPVAWDNSKLFFWCYLFFAMFSVEAISALWCKRGSALKLAALLLFVGLTATGFIELLRLQQIPRNQHRMTASEDIALYEEIRAKTGPYEVFLTATDHNHPAMMWAVRPVLMGFVAWVWNYGFEYSQREQDIKAMFLGDPRTPELLQKYRVRFVAIGPSERNTFHANLRYFDCRYEVGFENANYKVYDVFRKHEKCDSK